MKLSTTMTIDPVFSLAVLLISLFYMNNLVHLYGYHAYEAKEANEYRLKTLFS